MQGFDRERLNVETADGRNFVLLEPFSYTTKSGETITVPIGAESDGASTPEVLWSMGFPPFGPWWRAAFLHDHMYRDTEIPKDKCDEIFKEAVEACGVGDFKAEQFYLGVHLGGESSFEEDRAAQEKKE